MLKLQIDPKDSIDEQKLMEVLKEHFGTDSERKIEKMMIRSKMVQQTTDFEIQMTEKKPIPANVIKMLADCGIFIVNKAVVDINRIRRLLSEENFSKIQK